MTVDKKLYDHFVEQLMPGIWDIAKYVHANPETAYQEKKACGIQCEYLRKQGFRVQEGVEELDTAYIAVHGEGKPAIAVLSEYDALPMLGHGCGHNLLGAGTFAAALGLKAYLTETGKEGTVVLFGCPSEEKGNSKTLMARDGVFEGVDVAFTWHPADVNAVVTSSTLANVSVFFRFKGLTSHAAAAPDKGRSALDADRFRPKQPGHKPPTWLPCANNSASPGRYTGQ